MKAAAVIQIDVVHLQDHAATDAMIQARQYKVLQRKQQIQALKLELLSHKLRCEIADQDLAKTAWGKPYLHAYPTFAFNQSHSQKHYVLASSHQQADLGVDVEDLDRVVRFDALAQHAFHPEEYALWQAHDRAPELWFKIWTAKEAILKASGLGIRLSLNQLHTQIHAEHHGGICQHPDLGTFAYQHFQLAGCMLAVAWRSSLNCQGFALPKIELRQDGCILVEQEK